MTREKQIRKEAIEVTYLAQFGHSGRDMLVAYDAFILGAKWADGNPNPEIIKRVFLYALQHTNILLADDWDEVRWNLLIKKAMEE